MSGRRRPVRDIVCEVCGNPGRTQLRTRDICRACHRTEPSARCARCGLPKHDVATESGLCLRCTEMTARPGGICARCCRVRVICNKEGWLCYPCHAAALRRAREEGQPAKMACAVCGEVRSSILRGRPICPACWMAERNGRAICTGCGKLKSVAVKSESLCKQCYKDRLAPKAPREYVEGYATPFPYNRQLFDLLAATIKWDTMDQKLDRRFRAFGRFLRGHEFRESLTWEVIEAALPELGPANRMVPKQIRASLLDLGHLLAAQEKLESRKAYIARRNALHPIETAPQEIQPVLKRYAA